MPSIGLYPPELNIDIPVFQTTKINSNNNNINAGRKEIKFELSRFNSNDEYNVIHFTINYQKGGASAVSKINSSIENRYRNGSSIIIAMDTMQENMDTGSFFISEEDLIDNNWKLGELYKIQMRIGKVPVESLIDIQDNQENWINEHNREFSEWSTISVIKPIGEITIMVDSLKYNSTDYIEPNTEMQKSVLGTVLDFYGTYSIDSPSYTENLYSYEVTLYKIEEGEEIKLENSGIIYANKYNNLNRFKYVFHEELEQKQKYKVKFTYTTENGFKPDEDIELFLKCEYNEGYATLRDTLSLITPDLVNTYKGIIEKKNISLPSDFTVDKDNEEGRISIKLLLNSDTNIYNGNLILVRSDNRSNYTYWEDIQVINIVQQDINNLNVIYDYTVESGIIYTYGIQEVVITNRKTNPIQYYRTGVFAKIEYDKDDFFASQDPIIREFEHSYLLGENGIQLKLKFDNDMNNFKIVKSEGKIETIGGTYPFIMRNGNTEYKTFPINGLISWNMDDNNLFTNEYDVYGGQSNNKDFITKQYKLYNKIKNGYKISNNQEGLEAELSKESNLYDYIYESLFRDKVMKFLYDGKPKLFKSPTEGNIIINLMDISLAPKQELSRLIYSFSSTAYEIDKANMENYLKYNFFSMNDIITDFSVEDIKIGQVKKTFKFNENILAFITNKYSFLDINNKTNDEENKEDNIAGYKFIIDEIYDIQIEFQSKPYVIDNQNLVGYKMVLTDKDTNENNIIKVIGNTKTYCLDEMIKLTPSQHELKFIIDKDYYENYDNYKDIMPNEVEVIINFIYKVVKKPYLEKYLDTVDVKRAMGQIYKNIEKNISIISIIKNKHEHNYVYYYKDKEGNITDSKIASAKLLQFTGVNIEANPGSLFAIYDKNEKKETIFQIGKTGNLNIGNVFDIVDIKYLGPNNSVDILMDYFYIVEKGVYKDVDS